jgi:hypothetical protein
VQDESNDLRAWRWNGYEWGSTTPYALSSNLEAGAGHDVEPFALASVVPSTFPTPPRVDFNRDGKTDLMWHNSVTGGMYIWFLDGATLPGSTYLRPESFSNTQWQIRALADFDRDGDTDVLWHHVATGDLYAWILDGTVAVGGQYLTPRTVIDTQWQIRDAADLDGDGSPDLLWQHQERGELYAWFMDGFVQRRGASLDPKGVLDNRWQVQGVDDLNADGQVDILWRHSATGDLYVWLMNGTSRLSGAYLSPSTVANLSWRLAKVADFDGDRKPDLLWHHKTTGELYFWFLDGLVVKGGGYLSPSRFADPKWSIAPR